MAVHDAGPAPGLDRPEPTLDHPAREQSEVAAARDREPEPPERADRDGDLEDAPPSARGEVVRLEAPVGDPVVARPHREDRRVDLEADVGERLDCPEVAAENREVLRAESGHRGSG